MLHCIAMGKKVCILLKRKRLSLEWEWEFSWDWIWIGSCWLQRVRPMYIKTSPAHFHENCELLKLNLFSGKGKVDIVDLIKSEMVQNWIRGERFNSEIQLSSRLQVYSPRSHNSKLSWAIIITIFSSEPSQGLFSLSLALQ